MRVGPQTERLRVPRGSPSRFTEHMEQFQTAWVEALAAASGCIVWSAVVLDDGIDMMLTHKHDSHTGISERRATLNVQLKATRSKPNKSGSVSVPISRRRVLDYSVQDPTIPVIVAILAMPAKQHHWVYATHRNLNLYGACHWVNLEGFAVGPGADSDRITVSAPGEQVLDDVTLAQMMERIGKGGRP